MARYIGAILLAALVLWTVQACGPRIRYVYHKPGATEQQRKHDGFECERLSLVMRSYPYYSTGPGQPIFGGPRQEVDLGMFIRCMESRGYTVEAVPIPETSAPKEAE